MRTSRVFIINFIIISIMLFSCFSFSDVAYASEAPTEGTAHDLPDSGSSSSSSTSTNGNGSGTITIQIEDDDDDDDDDDDTDSTYSDLDEEFYYDEEYEIGEPTPPQEEPQPEPEPQTPTNGSGGNGNQHSLDSTPKTADGDIDPRFVFCLALFLVGLGTVLYSRQKRLSYLVGKHSRDDELD